MTQEHKDALISKCSRKEDVPMPQFAASPSKECENKLVSHATTPLPNDMATRTAGNKNAELDALKTTVKNMTLEANNLLSDPANKERAG
jgi:hypothetical protein